MINQTQDEGGCTVPWVIRNDHTDAKICQLEHNINTTFWEAYNRVTNQMGDCPISCHSLLINIGARNEEVDNTRTTPFSQKIFQF